MNVVDSCGWLEYFADGPNAEFFAGAIEAQDDLAVPVISLFEVFRRVSQQRGEGAALRATAIMLHGEVLDLDATMALAAARLSLEVRLPMSDSIMLVAARSAGATLWTQDADFADIPGVEYVPRAGPPSHLVGLSA